MLLSLLEGGNVKGEQGLLVLGSEPTKEPVKFLTLTNTRYHLYKFNKTVTILLHTRPALFELTQFLAGVGDDVAIKELAD